MEIQDDEDLVVRQEGASVRAIADPVDILFPKTSRDAIVKAYNEWLPKAREHFAPRLEAHAGARLEAAELRAILREITLNWMGYHVMHREPVHIDEREWDHPQSWRVIRRVVEARLGAGTEAAAALCAQLMGITREAFRKWAASDDTFLGIM